MPIWYILWYSIYISIVISKYCSSTSIAILQVLRSDIKIYYLFWNRYDVTLLTTSGNFFPPLTFLSEVIVIYLCLYFYFILHYIWVFFSMLHLYVRHSDIFHHCIDVCWQFEKRTKNYSGIKESIKNDKTVNPRLAILLKLSLQHDWQQLGKKRSFRLGNIYERAIRKLTENIVCVIKTLWHRETPNS